MLDGPEARDHVEHLVRGEVRQGVLVPRREPLEEVGRDGTLKTCKHVGGGARCVVLAFLLRPTPCSPADTARATRQAGGRVLGARRRSPGGGLEGGAIGL